MLILISLLLEVMRKSCGYFVILQSARGLAHSKTLRVFQESSCRAQRLGVRRPSAAFPSVAGAGLLAFACLLCGCISRSPCPVFPLDGTPEQGAERMTWQNLNSIFPAQYRSVQRAILTVAGKQFTCDGVLEVSTNAGWHLAIVSNLGLVAGLRVNRNGLCEVLQATPLFREAWTRQFVARDVRRLFIPPPEFVSAGRLADGTLVCKTVPDSDGAVARYVFSADGRQWQELDVWRGGRRVYHAVLRGYRAFAGIARDVPAEMEVQAEGYQLHLRLVELNPKDSIAPEAAR